ncbi:MAG: response regulator [Hespellia sp.]|nr:response regulator [Hespellia sp.]
MKVLIVDDERIERNGIKFLLGNRKEELTVFEAANGREALEMLKKERMDILFTDVKMPFMTGTELVEQARGLQPDIEMVIFSGYGEFEYAKQAIKSGVENYVLKPVDPIEFHSTFDKLKAKIADRQEREQASQETQVDLERYFLGKYIYQGTAELLEKIRERVDISEWEKVRALFLIESDDNFFEEQEFSAQEKLCEELNQKVDFLNLSPERELCLLKSECDYPVFAKHICEVLSRAYGEKFYVAAGNRLDSIHDMPEAFKDLDMLMENKFYRKDDRVFLSQEKAEDVSAEQFMNDSIGYMIEDIHLNDLIHLQEHFKGLKKSAKSFQKYSQIYTKFLFSNLVKELYSQQHLEGRSLEESIQKIYELQSMEEVLKEIEVMIEAFEQRLDESKENSRDEVERAKSYIYAHYSEDISVEILAEQVYLSPGYFSYIFKKETGQNLSRFVKEYRIEQAKKRLAETNMKIVQICQETGFSNVSYFIKSFREYYGCTPEQFRKGELKDE